MKNVLTFSAVLEIATGIGLLVVPSLLGELLLGQTLPDLGIVVARVAGVALVGLGVACWPGPPLLGMLIYNAGVALYLAYVGAVVGLDGILLWPIVVLHAIFTALLARQAVWLLR